MPSDLKLFLLARVMKAMEFDKPESHAGKVFTKTCLLSEAFRKNDKKENGIKRFNGEL